ncbi:MAG: 3-isopropylmalate dehydratase large subunit [Gammaproteobacteria bacterium]
MSTAAGDRPSTLLEKIWRQHLVVPETVDTPAVLYVDLHLVHEVTSPQAFSVLRQRGVPVRRPDRTLATVDHSLPTAPRHWRDGRPTIEGQAALQVETLGRNCAEFEIPLLGIDSEHRGIVHVIGPEQGATQPGMTIVCGDSHTTTHGAFGALAFGIGTTEVGHVLATQCLLQRRPRALAVNVDGRLAHGVTAKDLALAVIDRLGVGGGTGYVIEYRGPAIRAMSMDERMTLCNMSIEAGARAGMVAPDDTTFEYLIGRPMVPRGVAWDRAVRDWRGLRSDVDAVFDREIALDACELEPHITWGTDPGMVTAIGGSIVSDHSDRHRGALAYMGLEHGQQIGGARVDLVFIGSCTNSRLSDLRMAATILRDRRVAPGVRVVIVPGSQRVKREAEAEGLDRVFIEAGAEWHESGCSLCIAMNGDLASPGHYVVSTSNRNFEGRQGPGARTLLASPLTAAACAVTGVVADPRPLLDRVRRIA